MESKNVQTCKRYSTHKTCAADTDCPSRQQAATTTDKTRYYFTRSKEYYTNLIHPLQDINTHGKAMDKLLTHAMINLQ